MANVESQSRMNENEKKILLKIKCYLIFRLIELFSQVSYDLSSVIDLIKDI